MDDGISEILPIYLLQHLDLEEYPLVNHPLTGPQFSARQQFNQTVLSYSYKPNQEISTEQLKDFHKISTCTTSERHYTQELLLGARHRKLK